MAIPLTSELYWLTLTTLLTALFWAPYVVNRLREYGPIPALIDAQGRTATDVPWADRMMRAHRNAVENLVIFAPLVLILHAAGISSSTTTTACVVYFFARAIHFVVFTFGIPLLRTLAFAAGFGAQVTLALVVLGVL